VKWGSEEGLYLDYGPPRPPLDKETNKYRQSIQLPWVGRRSPTTVQQLMLSMRSIA
jgi:hypothetical protein